MSLKTLFFFTLKNDGIIQIHQTVISIEEMKLKLPLFTKKFIKNTIVPNIYIQLKLVLIKKS